MNWRSQFDRAAWRRQLPALGKLLAGIASICAALVSPATSAQPTPAETQSRAELKKQLEAGNFKQAFDGFRQLAISPAIDPAGNPRQAGEDLALACRALQELGRLDELDDFREVVVRVHPKNWRLLWSAAKTYLALDHTGTIVAGKFHRGANGGPNGAGQVVNAIRRDRARALQLLAAAMPMADSDPTHADAAAMYLSVAHALLSDRAYGGTWPLRALTDLNKLPDYQPGWAIREATQGAPVDASGKPIFDSTPKRWADAANDGQRWRWALARAAELDPQRLNTVRWELAQFLQSQFSVETLADYRHLFDATQDDSADAGPYTLQTLTEDETIARLATGVKRFKLPDESNAIKIYEQIAAEPRSGKGAEAVEALANIFENRRQYDRAAECWERAIHEYGPGPKNSRRDQLDQVVGNWGRFEPSAPQAAGRAAKVDFTFRNGRHVSFEANPIKLDKLLADVKAYLKSNPHPFEGQKIDLQNIGRRLMEENQQKYVGPKLAAWDLELQPRRNHFDRRITVTTPLQSAGAYLLTAQMADGNTSHTVVWLDDMVIVKKPLADGTFYYVADAVSGQPISKANLELFGFRQLRPAGGKAADIETVDLADQTDADGQLLVKSRTDDRQFNWLVVATTPTGRLAFLGFTNIASSNLLDTEYNETKVFAISDRPAYRPGQKVKFKFWVRHAKYDQPDTSDFANQSFTVEIHDPQGVKLLSTTMTTDAYGGLDGEYAIPPAATPGVYQFALANYGGGSFRVEEDKRPEFEVRVETPSEPVVLGQKAKATIRVNDASGRPVNHATVKYTILRRRYDDASLFSGDWDWLYGPGYSWFGYDDDWCPSWAEWGRPRAAPSVFAESPEPPEVVAQREVPIGPDGTVAVEVDTSLAKAMHPDQDHRYDISAEVVDASSRAVYGNGHLLAARKPFEVFVAVDRGYYHVDETIRADAIAKSLDGKPIRGEGKLTLIKLAYKDGKPQELPVRDWNLSTGADGRATLQIKASEPGQYRFSFKLTDDRKRSAEGGYLFAIIGRGSKDLGSGGIGNNAPAIDGASFRFSDLELIPDRRQYSPGQTANLMINTARPDSAVLLFVRPMGGVYRPPKLLRLTGKSMIEPIAVQKRDMPNFFVEAITIADGKLCSEVRQIIVPPESRMLNVAVQPSRETYKPGQLSTVSLKLTDSAGNPVVGTAVVAIYDKALEPASLGDTASGSNIENIKAFFWRWSRSHAPQLESSLLRSFDNCVASDEPWMGPLGLFGESYGTSRASSPILTMPAAAADRSPHSIQSTVPPQFPGTALWAGNLKTNEKGEAEVSLNLPKQPATWRIKAWAVGHGTKVGEGSAEIRVRD